MLRFQIISSLRDSEREGNTEAASVKVKVRFFANAKGILEEHVQAKDVLKVTEETLRLKKVRYNNRRGCIRGLVYVFACCLFVLLRPVFCKSRCGRGRVQHSVLDVYESFSQTERGNIRGNGLRVHLVRGPRPLMFDKERVNTVETVDISGVPSILKYTVSCQINNASYKNRRKGFLFFVTAVTVICFLV